MLLAASRRRIRACASESEAQTDPLGRGGRDWHGGGCWLFAGSVANCGSDVCGSQVPTIHGIHGSIVDSTTLYVVASHPSPLAGFPASSPAACMDTLVATWSATWNGMASAGQADDGDVA